MPFGFRKRNPTLNSTPLSPQVVSCIFPGYLWSELVSSDSRDSICSPSVGCYCFSFRNVMPWRHPCLVNRRIWKLPSFVFAPGTQLQVGLHLRRRKLRWCCLQPTLGHLLSHPCKSWMWDNIGSWLIYNLQHNQAYPYFMWAPLPPTVFILLFSQETRDSIQEFPKQCTLTCFTIVMQSFLHLNWFLAMQEAVLYSGFQDFLCLSKENLSSLYWPKDQLLTFTSRNSLPLFLLYNQVKCANKNGIIAETWWLFLASWQKCRV